MQVDILMPKMGESIMEGTILKWHKQPGDKVERDETILEISTDKVDTEVPSPETGVITDLLFKEGDVVEVGNVIAKMDTDANAAAGASAPAGEEPKEEKKEEPKEQAPESETPKAKEEPKTQSKPEETKTEAKEESTETSGSTGGARFYSPLVLNIASKEGIGMAELEKIAGTGAEGRVTKKDILAYVQNRGSKPAETKTETKPAETKAEAPKETAKETPKQESKPAEKKIELPKPKIDYNEEGLSVTEFDNIRQKMAEHMVASVRISPHVTATVLVDLSAIDKARNAMRDDFKEKEGFNLSYMPFICEATVKALKDFPLVNSIIDDSGTPYKAITRNMINLGIAVAMDNGGLIVPVIKSADGKNMIGIARDLNDLAKRARVKKLTLDEIQGGTFSITNYGVFGNDMGTPIINQPQVAIMGLGAIKKRPMVIETEQGDFILPKRSVYITLSFDHRLIDGALGGQFVVRVKEYLENYTM
jgi:2-oxoglutarate dehydrogenase E2 component (dihydrolipoamide succinyltransferase)